MRAVIPVTLAGMRSDQALAWVFPEYSRTTLKSWILAGRVQVDGRCVAPRHVVSGGEAVELAPPPPSATLSIFGREHPEAIPIEVIHQDPEILVVNKPAGLVVHPGAGNREGTMLNALLHLDPGLAALPRAGIVHRLDKDTSGLLVIARSPRAHQSLVAQIKARRITREYQGIVSGAMVAGGSVEAAIGRHPAHRTRMQPPQPLAHAGALKHQRNRFLYAAVGVLLDALVGRAHRHPTVVRSSPRSALRRRRLVHAGARWRAPSRSSPPSGPNSSRSLGRRGS